MKFTGTVDVNRPIAVVAELFVNPDHRSEYQDGFERWESVSGNPGEDGAVAKLYYSNRGREMVLTETVVANRLPESFEAFYEHSHMDNTLKTTFTALSANRTRYDIEGEYTALRGFVPNVMARLFPRIFTKQAQGWLDNFKDFAEDQ